MIIGIGASSYAMRCSVTVDTQDLATQREIASAIQGNSTSGLKDLWMITFLHNVKIKLTCGVESFKDKIFNRLNIFNMFLRILVCLSSTSGSVL